MKVFTKLNSEYSKQCIELILFKEESVILAFSEKSFLSITTELIVIYKQIHKLCTLRDCYCHTWYFLREFSPVITHMVSHFINLGHKGF